jgi:hypothetical protein
MVLNLRYCFFNGTAVKFVQKKEWISKTFRKERRECTVHRTGNERGKNTIFKRYLSEEEEESMTRPCKQENIMHLYTPVAGNIYCSFLAINISGADLLSSQRRAVR